MSFIVDDACIECGDWVENHYWCQYRRAFSCTPCGHDKPRCDA